MEGILRKARKAILPTLLLASTLMPFSEAYSEVPKDGFIKTINYSKNPAAQILISRLEESLGVKFNGVDLKGGSISKYLIRGSFFLDFDSYTGNAESLPETVIDEKITFYLIPSTRKKVENIWNILQSKPANNENLYSKLIRKEFEGQNPQKEEFLREHTDLKNTNSFLRKIVGITYRKESDLDDKLNISAAESLERGYIIELLKDGEEYLELALSIEKDEGMKDLYLDLLKEKDITRKKIRERAAYILQKKWPDLLEDKAYERVGYKSATESPNN